MSNRKLTIKQENFCLAYVDPKGANGNASEAYRCAFNTSRMKPATINRKATELMQNGMITARIAQLRINVIQRAEIDASYVLRRLVEIDEMDVADILNADCSLLPISEWPKVWRQYLSGMDILEIGSSDNPIGVLKKIKWPDKLKNLELLGKHLQVGAFVERVDVTSKGESVAPKNYVVDASTIEGLAKLLEG